MDVRPKSLNHQDNDVRPLVSEFDIQEPSLQRLYLDWYAKKKERNFPHLQSIDLLDYPEEASRWSILDVVDGGAGFYVRLCGTQIVNMIGIDFTGRHLSADLSELPGIAIQNRMGVMFRTVIDIGGPVVFGPKQSSVEGKEFMTFNSICLPFSEDGVSVTNIIHALSVVARS